MVVDGCMGDDETKVDIDSILVPCSFVNLVLTKAAIIFIFILYNVFRTTPTSGSRTTSISLTM